MSSAQSSTKATAGPPEPVTVVAFSPLRISFVGGGTDLPSFYESFGGEVVSITLSHRVRVAVTVRPDNDVWLDLPIVTGETGPDPAGGQTRVAMFRSGPTKLDLGGRADGGAELVRGAIASLGGDRGLDVRVDVTVPPGSGLGSSGALMVALAGALTGLQGRRLSPEEAAELAYHVEARVCGAPVGKQDHYSAAYGGCNHIVFQPRGLGTAVEPAAVTSERLAELGRRLILFHTPRRMSSRAILGEQNRKCKEFDRRTLSALSHLRSLCGPARRVIENGDLDELGLVLDEAWQYKKILARHISDPHLDELYWLALSAGATGGKLCGAGAGGCFVFYCAPERREALRRALEAKGLTPYDVSPSTRGLEVSVGGDAR